MRRKAVCASDETSNKVLGSEHPSALIRVQADGRGGKAFCASNGEHPIQYLGLSTQTPWPAKPTWHLPNRINDGQRQKSWMYKWWRHSSYYFDLLGGSTCQESGDTNFLFGRRIWAGGQAEQKKKKKKRNYDGNAGKGVFGVSGVGFDYLFFFGGSTSLRSHFSICP